MKPRLKAFELHGYKTFAGRILFEFPGNITAIVGPNGSGKSNIADALRWVLGEQSYSLLRGKKTEDMIFLGSDQRPRAGMASAMITFNNDDGWLPIDYSEVAIARRAYRDGSNEYLLNKQRVRLKDISELLGQSGLAERTYTIIGQGLVDAALSLRPEERRRFFEEAAGIGLFRARREESINRLDTTRRNLERVADILSELEPRVKSLERQAKRMEEYDRVKADLHVLLRDWYGFHWQNTQKELLRNKEILKNQEEKVTAARGKRSEIEKQVDSTRLRLQELRTTLNQLHAESAGYHTHRESISKNIAVLDERLRSHNNQLIALQTDLVRNEEEALKQAEKVKTIQIEKENLENDLLECREQQEQAQKVFSTRQLERNELDSILIGKRKQLVETETEQVQKKAHLRELENRKETLSTSLINMHQGIEKGRLDFLESQEKHRILQEKKIGIEEQVMEIEKQITDKHSLIDSLEEDIKISGTEVARLDAENAKVTAQLEVLLQAETALSGMGEGAKYLLNSSKSGKVNGTFRSLSSQLEVPAEFETAIGSVLGEQIDAVVFGAETDSVNILEFLEREDAGRTFLIPENFSRQVEKIKGIKGPGIIGVASELVGGSKTIGGLIHLILGQVLVVDNRNSARNLVKEIPVWGRIVTLSGEVFNGNGSIVAGKERRSALISRPRQRKDLQEKLLSLAEVRKNFESRSLELAGELRNRKDEKASLESKLKSLQDSYREVITDHESISRVMNQISQKLDWQNSQINTLNSQVTQSNEEITILLKEIEANAQQLNELNSSIQKTANELIGIPIDEIQTQLVHWNTTFAVNERSMKDSQRRYDEAILVYNQLTTSGKQISLKVEDIGKQILEVEKEKAAANQAEGELNGSIAVAREKILPAEGELSRLEAEYSTLQHNYSLTQQFEANADRVYSQTQLEFSRSRESLESLRRKIEEDFGLVTLEYSEDITGPTPLPLEGVSQLVSLTEIPKGLDDSINRQRTLLRRMGAINPDARTEYTEVKERHDFLSTQLSDLKKADADLRQIITELDELMHNQFRTTFNAVAAEFKEMFSRLFGGGSARLLMTDDENPTETGIDIEAKLPGRREQGLSLLSGGERSLTAAALIFSLLKVSPTPFCVLDEVDAMLDEANVGRFTELLKEMSKETQFIVITHNRNTVQVADVIYGVTMGRDSASQVISLRLDEVGEDMVK